MCIIEAIDALVSLTADCCFRHKCRRRYPHCVLDDGSDPGTGVAGTKCSACSPSSCDDNDPCTDDVCDPVKGCVHQDNGTCQCAGVTDWQCNRPPKPCGPTNTCACDVDTDGVPFCMGTANCEDLTPCTSNADCTGDTRCTSTCCKGGRQCAVPCASNGVRALRLSSQKEELKGPTTLGSF